MYSVAEAVQENPCVGCEVRNVALISECYEPNSEARVHFEFSDSAEKAIANTCISKLGGTGVAGEVRFAACEERREALKLRIEAINGYLEQKIASGELLIPSQE